MNERDLKYFCHLVETGNYTATAKEFDVTQPAISAAVKRLELQYGTTLFTQFNHRAQLIVTPAGRVLYVKARKIIKELSKIELEVKHANESQVRLGFSNVAGGIWLPKMIERFVKSDMLDQITTVVADSERLLTDLRKGKLDAAVFSTIEPEASTDLQVTPLETHQIVALVNAHHPFSKLKTIGLAELQETPIITRYENTLPRLALNQICHGHSQRLNILYEAANNQLVEGLIARNLGIGLEMDDGSTLTEQVVRVPLKADIRVNCYMQLAVRKSFLPNKNQERCIELLKDYGRE